ncbi:type II toxin-antitoxin system RelE/ParE family toxin [Streptomyces sp. YC504]|uniref:Type II toxin-antitoxin system RelE/ParE family toxin n=1 Tax=Streptomyces mesophilus TaxID=1775132 RepID=A0A6G4XUQ1_9ACTN|nr:type II toxin-antitoxin system RelE/ParE family toxin [Streptomyces mesophilus]NGO81305.1 type II toxin-antitoxin system RelE/ParE family toxin [Streptomyces mesophilus]
MAGRYEVEIEPEVEQWLAERSPRDFVRCEYYADLLADNAETLGEPRSRHLGGKVRELRFHLGSEDVRITYWLAPGRRVVLLTVFRKTRMREAAEVDRAQKMQALCESEHPPAAEHAVFSRTFKKGELT